MLISFSPKYSISYVMGYLKGKRSLMIFDRHANLKYKYGNRHFWARGYFVDTVGKNKQRTIEDVKRALCCADNKATKLLRELEKFGLIERKRRGLGKPSLVYVKNFSAESSKSIFQNRDFHDSGGFKNASQDPSKSRCNKTKENDTEMSETDPFYSEESYEMSKRTQLEEFFFSVFRGGTSAPALPGRGGHHLSNRGFTGGHLRYQPQDVARRRGR